MTADIAALQAIARRTISASYRSFLGDQSVDGFIESGEPDRYVEDRIQDCTVISLEGGPAGFCVCKDGLVDLMIIDHALRRNGLGTHLLKHCEAKMFERFDELMLKSFEPNDAANAFYRKNGWKEGTIAFDSHSGVNMITFFKRMTVR